jgi:hypothetical protein
MCRTFLEEDHGRFFAFPKVPSWSGHKMQGEPKLTKGVIEDYA